MAFHTRHQRAQRYNKPGTFIPSQQTQLNNQQSNFESNPQPPLPQSNNYNANVQTQPQQQQAPVAPPVQQQQQQPLEVPPLPPLPPKDEFQESNVQMTDASDDFENGQDDSEESPKKPWMKPKGVVKISNKERRRRQNERLSKVLIPKNALMILNELNHGDVMFDVKEVTNNMKDARMGGQFMASLNTVGNEYRGFAPSKVMARNVAAEQAIRDLILKKLEKQEFKAMNSELGDGNGDVEMASEDDDTIPIIKLASFALHKLFADWQAEGFKIPAFGKAADRAHSKASSVAGSDVAALEGSGEPRPEKPKKAKEPKTLPADAVKMHPCMLLGQMRQNVEYQEISVEGDKPQNIMFTMGVNIDGVNYIGRASNKKEARKNAARAACQSIFDIQYENQQEIAAKME